MRLDKYLANSHEGSRSEVRALIQKGLVTVNSKVIKDPAAKVVPEDEVICNGTRICFKEHYYYMLNKPPGYVSATEDGNERTVLELFPEKLRKNLFPVGRLDKDSVGLLLVCDDGELSHRLLSPASHVDKVYLIHTDEPLTDEDVKCFADGMTLEDGTKLQSANLLISAEAPKVATVTIREGKYHQIKRMIACRGKKVIYLKRLSMGGLTLDPGLCEGQFRELTPEEIAALTAPVVTEKDNA